MLNSIEVGISQIFDWPKKVRNNLWFVCTEVRILIPLSACENIVHAKFTDPSVCLSLSFVDAIFTAHS